MNDIELTKRFLKERLQRDFTTFRGHVNEWKNVHDLLKRTAEIGESNSALLIGPRGSGKTTLISSVLQKIISNDPTFLDNTIIVYLNGLIHTDDRLALKSATIQLNLENVVDGKVFGSFAENLQFLLESLKTSDNNRQQLKNIVFILEEFDLFCNHHNQTLLYNLFDISKSSNSLPICIIGITCRLDVIELLEKRVKSRFSHRQIFLFSQNNDNSYNDYFQLFIDLLKLPDVDDESEEINNETMSLYHNIELYTLKNQFNKYNYKFSKKFVKKWNNFIEKLIQEDSIKNILQNLYDYDVNQSYLKSFLFKIISKLNIKNANSNQNGNEFIKLDVIQNIYKEYEIDDIILLLCELSILEICLLISIKHHLQIYNGDPFNFEIIYNRFIKFSKTSTILQGIERSVILKAFEHLRNLEFIQPVNNNINNNSMKLQKEFQMYKLLLTNQQIDKGILKYESLPTEISQWAQSCLI